MKYNGKTRLISFGCSFTAGYELIDHELLGISFDECNKIKRQWTADKKLHINLKNMLLSRAE
jgi:hypothetical protein